MQLDEVREQYKIIARSANARSQQRKLEFLEHNLDTVNSVQKQLVEQNTALRKETAIAERKLLARNDRIQNLEAMLGTAEQKLVARNQKYEADMAAIRDRVMIDGERTSPSQTRGKVRLTTRYHSPEQESISLQSGKDRQTFTRRWRGTSSHAQRCQWGVWRWRQSVDSSTARRRWRETT